MKNAQLILAVVTLISVLFTSAGATSLNDDNRTIILINGAPFVVNLDQKGDLVETIAWVPEYFASSESHNDIVSRIADDYEVEKNNIKSRLLIFEEDKAILDYMAVEHIRDMSRLYSKGYIQSINISAAHTNDFEDEALAANRINVIYQMLKDFGVDDNGITADMKHYKSDLPNQFIRLNIN